VLLVLSLTSGCQTPQQPQPQVSESVSAAPASVWPSTPAPQQRPLTGRLALTVYSEPTQSWVASFELRGDARQGSLLVFSPLGSVLSTLRWSPENVVLGAGDKTIAYASLADLTQAATGTPLPIEALFDWLAGKPSTAPGWQADLSRQAQGRISAVRTAPEPRAELRVVLDTEDKPSN
jgi:outer membrane lipoprotein LolB